MYLYKWLNIILSHKKKLSHVKNYVTQMWSWIKQKYDKFNFDIPCQSYEKNEKKISKIHILIILPIIYIVTIIYQLDDYNSTHIIWEYRSSTKQYL